MKTISIVEDNKDYQEALLAVIKSVPDFIVQKIYSNAEDATKIFIYPTDIAIIDIKLPGMSGIDLIKELTEKNSKTIFLVCSMSDDDESIFNALRSGASGYILKHSNSDEIIRALNDVVQGGAPMSPYIAQRVIRSFKRPPIQQDEVLTDRETDVLKLLATGLQYKEIAEQLFISYETVKKHLKNIYQKLHVQNKVEAINKFRNS